MFAAGNDLVSFIEEFAPAERTLPGDVSGLQWGDLRREAPALILALDFSEDLLEEALRLGASFILTHHPFLYRPLKKLDLSGKREALLVRALKEDITLYSAHTNLDVADHGVSHALGNLFNLKKMRPLFITGMDTLEKLVVFVPEGYEDKVRNAVCEAGAGCIGNYSHCTFQLLGTGTFLPMEGAASFIGRKGAMEKVSEYRLETILPRHNRKKVLDALFDAHPYEEVAYDLFPLENEGQVWGLGRIGNLEEEITLKELTGRCEKLLQPASLTIVGDEMIKVKKIAVLGGSGADYLESVKQSGCQVLISGDIKYHDAQKAKELGLALIDAGHEATERPVLPVLAAFLMEKIKRYGFQTKVIVSQESGALWRTRVKG
jgi:dinuclear metal center YbgI/SA1388 family protein